MSENPCNGSISEVPNIAYLKKLTMYRIGFNIDKNCHCSPKISIE